MLYRQTNLQKPLEKKKSCDECVHACEKMEKSMDFWVLTEQENDGYEAVDKSLETDRRKHRAVWRETDIDFV